VRHTILWYNALGALCLTAAAWSSALAPRLSRQNAGMHAILAAALLVGGVTKVTFQVAALGAVVCFCAREAVRHRSSRGGAGALVGFALLFGVVFPVLFELWATGASVSIWLHNVLQLAGHDRAGYLLALANWHLYFEPRHDYYGELALPQVGAVIVAAFGIVLASGWANRDRQDRACLVLFTTGFAFAALALLATNHEIAYVGLGTALGLATALALAFDLRPRSRLAQGAIAGPLLLVALVVGQSAWRGQRSQLGRPSIARSTYVRFGEEAPRFRYISGVWIPPALADSLQRLAQSIPPPRPDGRHPVLFTAGLEWLDRIWPPVRIPRLPLWYAHGTSAGDREDRLLEHEITHPEQLRHVYASPPWDFRTPELDHLLLSRSDPPVLLGPLVRDYRLRTFRSTPEDLLNRINALGCNYDPALLSLGPDIATLPSSVGRPLLGISSGSGQFEFLGRAGRMRARAVLRRSGTASATAITRASFRIETCAKGTWQVVQSQTLQLAPTQTSVDWTHEFDSADQPVRFHIKIEPGAAGGIAAGWEAPSMVHGPDDGREPPRLFADEQNDDPAIPSAVLAPLYAAAWRPSRLLTRGALPEPCVFALKPGGQVWMKPSHDFASIEGTVRCLANEEGETPVVRVLWTAGDQIQILDQFGLDPAAGERRFRAWSAGRGGWLGLIVDPNYAAGPVSVRIERSEP